MDLGMKLILISLPLCFYLTTGSENDDTIDNDVTKLPGHLKPFGEGRPSAAVAELDGFPEPGVFFRDYVQKSIPVVMRNAAVISPAFNLWTDEYLAAADDPTSKEKLLIEAKKKENRSEPAFYLTLKQFLGMYNKTDIYLVEGVPSFLGKDVILPCVLQCTELFDSLIDKVMWFSSGGTKSVVHTDSVENVNCLYRGEKKLVFVNPKLYNDKVDIDKPEGSYSSVDVDSVDYTKFPGLAEVEYNHVEMQAGDCLYIPYMWIHQVRSYGSNLAVNVWFDHQATKHMDLNTCQKCDKTLTLDKFTFHGFAALMESEEHVRDGIYKAFTPTKNSFSVEEFIEHTLGEDNDMVNEHTDEKVHIDLMSQIFEALDTDKDLILTKDDLDKASDEAWKEVQENYKELSAFLDEVFESIEMDKQEGEDIIAEKMKDEL